MTMPSRASGLPAAVWAGTVRWSVSGYMDVLAEYTRLLESATDDRDGGHTHPIIQIIAIFRRRYSGTRLAAYCWRWLEIGHFMDRYDDRLRRDGWIRGCDEPA